MKAASKFSYTVEELTAEASMDEFMADCVDVPKFLPCCMACPNYAGSWSCPPYDFDPMDIWRRFSRLRLCGRLLVPNGRKQALEGAVQAMEDEKLRFLEALLGHERVRPGSMALAAGSCTICVPCARKGGKPCRYPERMRYSIEALGGDVGLTARRYLGRELLWPQGGVLPEYFMLVGGLLLPSRKAE